MKQWINRLRTAICIFMNPKHYIYQEAVINLDKAHIRFAPVKEKMLQAGKSGEVYELSVADTLLQQQVLVAEEVYQKAYKDFYGVEPLRY